MSDEIELRPCPFCGGEVFLDVDHDGSAAFLHANGKKCRYAVYEIYVADGMRGAIAAYNARPLEDALRLALDAANQHARACEQATLDAIGRLEEISIMWRNERDGRLIALEQLKALQAKFDIWKDMQQEAEKEN